MTGNKVGPHTQLPPGCLGEYVNRSKAPGYKGIGHYPDIGAGYQIMRCVNDQNGEFGRLPAYIAMGRDGARPVFDACVEEIDKNRHMTHVLYYNEPPIWVSDVLAGFVDFNQELISLHRARYGYEMGILVGAINTGHPKLITEDGGREMDVISRAFQGADGYAVHAYHPKDLRLNVNSLLCRYRHMHNYCESIGRQHPPFFVLELGLDAPGGPWKGHFGWQEILDKNWPLYRDMLVFAAQEFNKDDYVELATFYLTQPSYGWTGFEINCDQMMDLADRLAALPDAPPPPPPPPTPPPPPSPPPFAEMAQGTYLSYHQQPDDSPPIDWDVLAAEVDYLHLRVGHGDFKDSRFEEFVAKSEEYGLPWSAWWFLTQKHDGQAQRFLDSLGDHIPPMRIFTDCEDDELTPEKVARHFDAVDRVFGEKDGAYTNLANQHLFTYVDKAGRRLWVADWGLDRLEPRLPAGWDTWEFWQWHDGVSFPGIPTTALPDAFNGTPEQLREKYGLKEPEEPTMKTYYYKIGEEDPISRDEWEGLGYGAMYNPYKTNIGDGTNDGVPGVKAARIVKIEETWTQTLQVVLTMADGSVPVDIDKFSLRLKIFDNDWEVAFTLKDTGFYEAHFMMSWYLWPNDLPKRQDSQIYIQYEGKELHSEQVHWVGMVGATDHHSAKLWYIMWPDEDAPPPPPPPPETYDVATVVVPEGKGCSVIPSSMTDVPADQDVTFLAVEGSNMTFVRWSDQTGNTNDNNPVTFPLQQDLIITATFKEDDEPPPPPPPPPTDPDIVRAVVLLEEIDALALAIRARVDDAILALVPE